MGNIDKDLEVFYKIIGSNVKQRREAKNMTQLELSQHMSLNSSGLISQGELYINKQHFNLKHLYMIGSILEVNISEFFEGVEMLPKEYEY